MKNKNKLLILSILPITLSSCGVLNGRREIFQPLDEIKFSEFTKPKFIVEYDEYVKSSSKYFESFLDKVQSSGFRAQNECYSSTYDKVESSSGEVLSENENRVYSFRDSSYDFKQNIFHHNGKLHSNTLAQKKYSFIDVKNWQYQENNNSTYMVDIVNHNYSQTHSSVKTLASDEFNDYVNNFEYFDKTRTKYYIDGNYFTSIYEEKNYYVFIQTYIEGNLYQRYYFEEDSTSEILGDGRVREYHNFTNYVTFFHFENVILDKIDLSDYKLVK